jgi:transcriptional antiterminator NusG
VNDETLDDVPASGEVADDVPETAGDALERARELLGTSVAIEERPEALEESAADESVVADAVEIADGDSEPVRPPSSPFDLPGAWFVIHSYSGYENKVKANLTTRITSMHMEDAIFDVVIPMEDVVEIKSGRKVTVARKQFPGYLLVRMYLDDDSWGVVRNTPGVTGFVGSGTKPTPLSRREVERILGVRKDEEKKAPRFKPDWEVGETVRVTEGPFADFNGVIEDINLDQSKVRVLVDIFGRETPVELNFEQIQKF